jgi:anti-sigma regulatory factor (Ser/Thr protein kinase)
MTNRIDLKVETRPGELERIFATVEKLAEEEDWSPALTFKTNLVLEEFGLNIMNYGYDEGLHSFDICLVSSSDSITIEFIDGGRPFNPLEDGKPAVTEGAIDDRPVGGLGIYFVMEMTEDFQYRREGTKNHSTMVIRKDSD